MLFSDLPSKEPRMANAQMSRSAKDKVLDSTIYLAEIFRHLTPPDIKNAVLVCRSIRIIIKVVFIFRCI